MTELSTIPVSVCTICIQQYKKKCLWNWQKIRGKTLFVCHRNSAWRYTCHTEMVKNAGCGLICWQMQQFCPCQHCDVLTTLTRTLPGLKRFYAELPSSPLWLFVCPSRRPVDILVISYITFPWRHFSTCYRSLKCFRQMPICPFLQTEDV